MSEYSKHFDEMEQIRQSFIKDCPPGSKVEIDLVEDGEKVTGITAADTHIYAHPLSTCVMVERIGAGPDSQGVFDMSSIAVLERPQEEEPSP